MITAYAFAVLWIHRIDADQPLTFRFALRETASGLVGLHAGARRT